MVDVHITGMGWFGVIAGQTCEDLGLDFTWHDTNHGMRRAWPASTGIVYPAGDPRSSADHKRWLTWHADKRFPESTTEVCSYWFNHKNPPHKGRYAIASDAGALRRAESVAIQVNVPKIVSHYRERWASRQTEGPSTAGLQIIAHGFNRDRSDRVVWGWTKPVSLTFAPSIGSMSPYRPTIYTRKGRFAITYAYAMPGDGTWWAGSSLITQAFDKAKPLDGEKHYRTWSRNFTETTGGLIEHAPAGAVIQGWRPRPMEGDSGNVEANGNTITVPPLWHSGLRWAPTVALQLKEAMIRCRSLTS